MNSKRNRVNRSSHSLISQIDRHCANPHEQSKLLVADAMIMMVDDEALNMDVLKIHLESEGYTRFLSVSDSTLAIDTIRKEKPDVLLLDLVMPGVSGYDILTTIRDDDELRYLPVIVLTSANDASTKLTALQLGATDFLAKPVDASELALRMRNTLTARAWQKRISEIDALTGLPNRAWFTQFLRNRLIEVGQGGSSSALILININRFKSINNSLGPARGDEVLSSFSDRLILCYREGVKQHWFSNDRSDLSIPVIARLDGDRFVIHMPINVSANLCNELSDSTEKLLNALNEPFNVSGQGIYLNVSVGVSFLGNSITTVEALINNAETAMSYAMRRNDTDFAIYSDDMDAKARELLSMENGLRTAVDKGEIFLVYQPKVDVSNNEITGAEALARWMHPEFGLISPVNFIPLAENSGMIVSIGEWVLRESCIQTKRWHDRGYSHLKIAVNVSIRQLHEQDFIETVKLALNESQLPPGSLIIELTENMIMENAESNVVKLRALKSLGVQISIDDFGTGYSSLSYLQRFPLDQLKIDRSFIMEIQSETKPMPIVKAVISLAHDLGLTVVAEGVETEAQLLYIRSLDCEEFQGYLCSKPVTAVNFLKQLQPELKRQA